MRGIILVFIGISGGLLVAGGMFAFITMIGVVQRMVAGSKTAKYVRVYENAVIAGCTFGNIVWMYKIPLHLGPIFLCGYGFFSGIYVGCLSFALAEILNVLPIFTKRLHLKVGIPYVIASFAFGKLFGALYQFFGF